MKYPRRFIYIILLFFVLHTSSSAAGPDRTGIFTGDTLATGSDSLMPFWHLKEFLEIEGKSPWLAEVTYFGHSYALVYILLAIIILSISSVFVLLVIILLNRTRMEKVKAHYNKLLEKYQTLVIDYLFGSTSSEEFLPIASDNFNRQVLIDQIIDLSVNLKGDSSKKLAILYKTLGLEQDSIRKAKSREWHLKIKGFRELAFMNISDANPVIYKALNSSNEILRMEAQVALVRLNADNPFGFLSHLAKPFSLWEQMTLHELMVQHEITPPPFSQWMGSSNETVVMFSLRMIREFRQIDAEPQVRMSLFHDSENVRHLAAQVAGDLEMRSTLPVLMQIYGGQDPGTCLQILKSIGKMPHPSMLEFLKRVIDKEENVQLQIEATKAIENMGEEGIKELVKMMKSEYRNYKIIIRHVLDKRIY